MVRSIRVRFRWLSLPGAIPGEPSILLNPTTGLGIAQWSKPEPGGLSVATGVSPDIYSVLVSGIPVGACVHQILAGGADITQTGLDLVTGTATDLDVVFTTACGTATGQVLDANRQPLPGARVFFGRTASLLGAYDLSSPQSATTPPSPAPMANGSRRSRSGSRPGSRAS